MTLPVHSEKRGRKNDISGTNCTDIGFLVFDFGQTDRNNGCKVSSAISLRARCEMSGTDIASLHSGYAMSDTEIAYGAARARGDRFTKEDALR
eukprot:587935-Rhodomonas_salina.5